MMTVMNFGAEDDNWEHNDMKYRLTRSRSIASITRNKEHFDRLETEMKTLQAREKNRNEDLITNLRRQEEILGLQIEIEEINRLILTELKKKEIEYLRLCTRRIDEIKRRQQTLDDILESNA